MIKKIVTIILIIMTIINTIAPTKTVLAEEIEYENLGVITAADIPKLIEDSIIIKTPNSGEEVGDPYESYTICQNVQFILYNNTTPDSWWEYSAKVEDNAAITVAKDENGNSILGASVNGGQKLEKDNELFINIGDENNPHFLLTANDLSSLKSSDNEYTAPYKGTYTVIVNGEKLTTTVNSEGDPLFSTEEVIVGGPAGVQTITAGNPEDNTKAGWLESWLTRIFVGIGDMVLKLIKSENYGMGSSFTLDGVIFNEYPPTIIDFWGTDGDYTSAVKSVVNETYKIFRTLAIIMYIIMLIYVAIKIFLSNGKDKYKELVTNWIMGLVLLFLMPYVMKYILQINNAIVAELAKNREYQILTYYNVKGFADEGISGEDTRTKVIEKLREQLATAWDNVYGEGGIYSTFSDTIKNVPGLERNLSLYTEYMGYAKNANTDEKRIEYETIAKRYLSEVEGLVKLHSDKLSEYGGDINKILEAYKKVTESEEYREMVEVQNNLLLAQKAQDTDLIGQMAEEAGKTGRFIYAIIFWILLVQLIFIIILYIKRIFMLAALIIVFPLVMITYVIDKSGDAKAQTFSTWLKEYIVNITIQIFHAIIYLILIEAGVKIYANSNHENWLFFAASILFIFPAEQIMRGIFGLKSSTLNNLGGILAKMAGTAAAVFALRRLKDDGTGVRKGQEKRDNEYKKMEEKDKKSIRATALRNNEKIIRQRERTARKRKIKKDSTRAREKAYLYARNGLSHIQDFGGSVANGAAKVGRGFRKLNKFENRKISKFSNSYKGKIFRAARKTAGIGIGAAVALSAGGSTGDFITGTEVAKTIGGFKNKNDYK